ncbi:MAG: efflux RND transporter periplasmic adaptor subunit [Gammaproteobacteria bacterium]|nr:MAG: efflux RND transporter periplasmic adaptor subunit [Gammaproteobacteria bacterium]
MKKNKLLTIFLAILAIALVIGLVMLRKHRIAELDDIPTPQQAAWAVNSAPVLQGSVSQGFSALAEIQSSNSTRILPQISATILKMGPREGGAVKKGDLLVQLDTREQEANLAALNSQLTAAKADAKRNQDEAVRESRLAKKGGSSAAAVEKWRTAAKAARAKADAIANQIEALQIKIGYCNITAPIDAKIAQRMAEPGDVALPGKPIYILSADHGGRVAIPVPMAVLEKAHVGGDVLLRHGKDTMKAEISRIDPTLDKHAMGHIEIDLDDRPFGLPEGYRVPARIISNSREDSLVVPANTVVTDKQAGHGHVFRIESHDGREIVKRIPVDILLKGAEGFAVSGDIKPGDKLVEAHESVLLRLRDGDPVQSSTGVDGE